MQHLIWTSALTVLAMVFGCKADGDKKDKGDTKEDGATTEEQNPGEPGPLGKSGDQKNEDSPDSQFYAEQYVEDALATHDDEAFQGDLGASLALQGDDSADASGEDAGGADAGAIGETSETADANEVEAELEPDTDAEPTANLPKLIHLIVEFVMSIADGDGDGSLSRDEFVGAVYFPELNLPADVRAKIEERRAKWFDSKKGDDELLSAAELEELLTQAKGHVNKLRLLRYLPYADHLAEKWKAKKKEFDANADGKLDEEELKKFREARHERKQERRAFVIAATYGLCVKLTEQGGEVPEWFKALQDKWGEKIKEKKSFFDKWKDQFKPKEEQNAQLTMTSLATGTGTGDGVGGDDEGEADGEEEAGTTSGSDDPCAKILDRAESFGLGQEVLDLLKEKGIIKDE